MNLLLTKKEEDLSVFNEKTFKHIKSLSLVFILKCTYFENLFHRYNTLNEWHLEIKCTESHATSDRMMLHFKTLWNCCRVTRRGEPSHCLGMGCLLDVYEDLESFVRSKIWKAEMIQSRSKHLLVRLRVYCRESFKQQGYFHISLVKHGFVVHFILSSRKFCDEPFWQFLFLAFSVLIAKESGNAWNLQFEN